MNKHDFEQAVVGGLPLGEAAAFFIKLKTASVKQAETLTGDPATADANDQYARQMWMTGRAKRTETDEGGPVVEKTAGSRMRAALAAMQKVAYNGDINQWMAREQMMQQAQEGNSSDYFKSQSQAAQSAIQQKDQEAQQLQEQMQATQQQLQEMQAQLDQSGQMQRQVLDQARMVEQQATQSAAAAHQAATAATLQSMQSSQEVLRHKMMTADMQRGVQDWKGQIMQLAQSDPTVNAGQQIGMPDAGPPPPPVTGMVGTQPQQAGASTQPEQGQTVSGPADQAPSAGATPSAPSPEGGEETPKAQSEQPEPEKSVAPASKQASAWAYYRMLSEQQGGGVVKTAFPFPFQPAT